MLLINAELKHKQTNEIYVLKERLPISWVKVLVKQDDPDVEVQIFPRERILEFKRV